MDNLLKFALYSLIFFAVILVSTLYVELSFKAKNKRTERIEHPEYIEILGYTDKGEIILKKIG